MSKIPDLSRFYNETRAKISGDPMYARCFHLTGKQLDFLQWLVDEGYASNLSESLRYCINIIRDFYIFEKHSLKPKEE